MTRIGCHHSVPTMGCPQCGPRIASTSDELLERVREWLHTKTSTTRDYDNWLPPLIAAAIRAELLDAAKEFMESPDSHWHGYEVAEFLERRVGGK